MNPKYNESMKEYVVKHMYIKMIRITESRCWKYEYSLRDFQLFFESLTFFHNKMLENINFYTYPEFMETIHISILCILDENMKSPLI